MRALGLTDGSAGMVAQVKSLADAMNIGLDLKQIQVEAAWHLLPSRAYDLGFAKLFRVTKEARPLLPDLVISCGRKAGLVAASWRTGCKRTKFIHIQDPQMSASHFDAVVAMAHDKLRAKNVITVPLALHSITPQTLHAASRQWCPKFEHLPRPWNAVLIGGSTNRYNLVPGAMRALIEKIDAIEGSLLITSSRRTGEVNTQLLDQHFRRNKRVFLYTGEMENPYLGMLACADKIYVTNDSVNMMSEALASGKPVEVLALEGHRHTKPARFAETLSALSVNPQTMMQALAESLRQMLAISA